MKDIAEEKITRRPLFIAKIDGTMLDFLFDEDLSCSNNDPAGGSHE